MATSFPYLQVARTYNVDYARVLQFSDRVDSRSLGVDEYHLPYGWMAATVLAWGREVERRKEVEPNTVQWSAINDPTSWDPAPSAGSIKLHEMDQLNPVGTAMAAYTGRPARWPHED